MLEYTKHLVGLRRDHPVLRRRRFFLGRAIHNTPELEPRSAAPGETFELHPRTLVLLCQPQEALSPSPVKGAKA